MIPDIYWINVQEMRLAFMPRPRAGDWLEDEVIGWRRSGIEVVVSLLEYEESKELGIEGEYDLCSDQRIEFYGFPIKDRGVPASKESFNTLITMIVTKLREGKIVAIHCRAGIGRSTLVAGCVLGILGVPKNEIFPMLSSIRGVVVPDTQEQEEWVYEFLKVSCKLG